MIIPQPTPDNKKEQTKNGRFACKFLRALDNGGSGAYNPDIGRRESRPQKGRHPMPYTASFTFMFPAYAFAGQLDIP